MNTLVGLCNSFDAGNYTHPMTKLPFMICLRWVVNIFENSSTLLEPEIVVHMYRLILAKMPLSGQPYATTEGTLYLYKSVH